MIFNPHLRSLIPITDLLFRHTSTQKYPRNPTFQHLSRLDGRSLVSNTLFSTTLHTGALPPSTLDSPDRRPFWQSVGPLFVLYPRRALLLRQFSLLFLLCNGEAEGAVLYILSCCAFSTSDVCLYRYSFGTYCTRYWIPGLRRLGSWATYVFWWVGWRMVGGLECCMKSI